MNTVLYQKLIHLIENYTFVQLAGTSVEVRLQIAKVRIIEVRGMLQIARRLPDAHALVHFLENHHHFLEKEMAGR